MSIATVVTRGYGSFGSIAEVVTRGYAIGEAVVVAEEPELTGAPLMWYWRPNRYSFGQRRVSTKRPRRETIEKIVREVIEVSVVDDGVFGKAQLLDLATQAVQWQYPDVTAKRVENVAERINFAAAVARARRKREDEDDLLMMLL